MKRASFCSSYKLGSLCGREDYFGFVPVSVISMGETKYVRCKVPTHTYFVFSKHTYILSVQRKSNVTVDCLCYDLSVPFFISFWGGVGVETEGLARALGF